MSNILTQEDLKELTGSPLSKKQIEILASHGIKFITRTDGKIRTTWVAVNSVLAQKQNDSDDEPELDFLRHG